MGLATAFLLSSLIGLLGWLVRRRVPETQSFLEMVRLPQDYLSLYPEYAKQLRSTLKIISMTLFITVLSYLIYVFSVTYMTNILQYTMRQALSINIISIVLLVLLEPWAGKLSDYIGRRPLMMFTLVGSILWIWPYFWLLQQQNFILALLAQGVMTIFAATYFSVQGVTMVEIVSMQMRFSVVTFANAVAVSIFGGITPFIASLLLKTTNFHYSLALYISVCALISLFAVYKVRETSYRLKTDE